MDRSPPEDHSPSEDGADWASLWGALFQAQHTPTDPWRMLAITLLEIPEEIGRSADATTDRLRAALEEWQRQWELPGEQQMVRALRSIIELRHLYTPALAALAPAPANPWPLLGPLQHEQAKIEGMLQAHGAYREALLRHITQVAALLEDCVGDFGRALAAEPGGHEPQRLLRLWSQIAESRYERQLDDDAFSRGAAEVANTGAALKLHTQALLDPLLEALGLPSTRALADTQQHVDRLGREHRAGLRLLEARLQRLEAGASDPSLPR